jgi:hypothetical protein
VTAIMARQSSQATREAWFKPIIDKIVDDPGHYLRPIEDAG